MRIDYITYYDYIDGDKLTYWQYLSKHYPYRNYRFWHFTFASKCSWLKKSVLYNTFSPLGFFYLLLFLVGIFTLCVEEIDYWLSFVVFSVAIVGTLFDSSLSYYFSFVKPRQIKTALQEFVESNRLEMIEERSLDRYLVRKDGYVFELAYAYENTFISNFINRKNLLVVRFCYKTSDRLLINQHGLVSLPFERHFKEYCTALKLDPYLFLDEHQISAAYPLDAPSSVTSKAIESLIDVLTHFGLNATFPDSFNRQYHYTIGNKSFNRALYDLCILFVYIAVIIVCLYVVTNPKYSAHGVPESDPIDRISEYYLLQSDIDLEKYEPDTLLFYATLSYDPINKQGAICVSLDDEAVSATESDTLGYYRMHNMVMLVSATHGLPSKTIEAVVGVGNLSALPPQSVMINQCDSIPAFRSAYYLDEKGHIKDRKTYKVLE